MEWPFSDTPDTAVFSSKDVVDDGAWIHYVSHDLDDGAWQFFSENGAPDDSNDARIVLFINMVRQDKTLLELADLPFGWIAWRESKNGIWKRKRNT